MGLSALFSTPASTSALRPDGSSRDAGRLARTSASIEQQSVAARRHPADARRLHRAAVAAQRVHRRARRLGAPGRVDTFNPYKLVQLRCCSTAYPDELPLAASDFPSIFNQRPREGMHLHWDGNNSSLAERNLSAALGAGVTPETVDHAAIQRVAAWLARPSAAAQPAPGRCRRRRTRPRALHECLRGLPWLSRPRRLRVRRRQARHGGAKRHAWHRFGAAEFLHRGLSPAPDWPSCSQARPSSSSISSRPMATPICRSTRCGCAALTAQRLGPDAAGPARAAGAAPERLRARHRYHRWQERRLRLAELRRRGAARRRASVTTPPSRQRQWRPHLRHHAAGRPRRTTLSPIC